MELVELVRAGDRAAYGELWSRHARAVAAISRSFTGYDPDDVTQETFARILEQLRAGNGPRTAFRAYAVMTARNVAANMARKRGSDDVTGVSDEVFEMSGLVSGDIAQSSLDRQFVFEVFRALPQRWQEALWYKDVEDLPVQQFATFLGMSENATSALLTRAREGFRQAWLAATVARAGELPSECRWTLEKIPQYVRGKATRAAVGRIEAHLDTCDDCTAAAAEARETQRRLFALLLPVMLGGPASAAYLEWLRSGSTGSEAPVDPAVASGERGSSSLLNGARASKAAVIPLALLATAALGAALSTMPPPNPPTLDAGQGTATETPHSQPAPVSETDAQTQEPRADGAPNEEWQTPFPVLAQASTTAPVPQTSAPRPPTSKPRPATSTPRPPTAPPPSPPVAPRPPTSPPDTPTDPEPPLDEPVRVPSTLSAAPVDGMEVGVYPRLLGAGVPGATVDITVSNELGETRTDSASVGKDGSWRFTPSRLRGQLTVTAHQSYTLAGTEYVEEPATIGIFSVGDGLRMKIVSTGTNQSTATVTGFGPESKNQSVNLTSSTLGVLAVNHRMTAPGEAVIVLPYARTALGDVTFWQGDTSQGPKRYWYIATTPK